MADKPHDKDKEKFQQPLEGSISTVDEPELEEEQHPGEKSYQEGKSIIEKMDRLPDLGRRTGEMGEADLNHLSESDRRTGGIGGGVRDMEEVPEADWLDPTTWADESLDIADLPESDIKGGASGYAALPGAPEADLAGEGFPEPELSNITERNAVSGEAYVGEADEGISDIPEIGSTDEVAANDDGAQPEPEILGEGEVDAEDLAEFPEAGMRGGVAWEEDLETLPEISHENEEELADDYSRETEGLPQPTQDKHKGHNHRKGTK